MGSSIGLGMEMPIAIGIGSDAGSGSGNVGVSAAQGVASASQAVRAGLDAIEEAEAADLRDDPEAYADMELERGRGVSFQSELAGGRAGALDAALVSLSPGLLEAEEAYRQEAVVAGTQRRRSRTTPAAPEWLGSVQSLLGHGGGPVADGEAGSGQVAAPPGAARVGAESSMKLGVGIGQYAGGRGRSLTGLSALSSSQPTESQYSVATAPGTAGALFSFSSAIASDPSLSGAV